MNFYDYRFFGKFGGVSNGIYKSLNCDIKSDDDLTNVFLNRKIVCNSLDGENKIFCMNQVHSDKVFVLETYDDLEKSDKIECDAVITNLQGVLLGVLTADCAPILFIDEKNKVVCACHAGWKGAYSDLFQNVLSIFKGKFNSDLKDIVVMIGPMIQQESYQVQEDFYNKWISLNKEYENFFDENENGYYFDLPGAIKYKLVNLGIELGKIEDMSIDTFSNDDYFSYRRHIVNGEIEVGDHKFGRNISVVKIV